jgi:hypothetical protein
MRILKLMFIVMLSAGSLVHASSNKKITPTIKPDIINVEEMVTKLEMRPTLYFIEGLHECNIINSLANEKVNSAEYVRLFDLITSNTTADYKKHTKKLIADIKKMPVQQREKEMKINTNVAALSLRYKGSKNASEKAAIAKLLVKITNETY